MVWPPPTQKSDWVNADVQQDLHPTAHNDIALTLANDFVPKIDTNASFITALGDDITDISDVYTPNGIIKGSNPELWSDAPFSRHLSGGTLYAYMDGIRDPQYDYLYIDPLQTVTTTPTSIGNSVSVTWPSTQPGYVLLSGWGELHNILNQEVFLNLQYRVAAGTWTGVNGSYMVAPNMPDERKETMVVPMCRQFVTATTGNVVDFRVVANTSTGQCTARRAAINVIPFFR